MNKSFRTFSFCLACALLSLTAWAQQPGQSGSSSSQKQTQPGQSSSQSSQPGLSPTGRSTGQSGQAVRASKQLMNATVKTQTGEELGQIQDLIVNPQTGRIEFAVIEVNDKLTPVPFKLLQPSPSATRPGATGADQPINFTAMVDKQKLQQAPSFERTQWPDISSPTWSQKVYSHYGVQPEAVGSPGTPSGTTTPGSSGTGSEPGKSGSQSGQGSSGSTSPSSTPGKSTSPSRP